LIPIYFCTNFIIPNSSPQILQIINDVDINFKISYAEHVEGSEGPDMKYKFLFDLSNIVSRAFSGPSEQAPTPTKKKTADSIQTSPQSRSSNISNAKDISSKVEAEWNPWTTISLDFEVNQIYLEIFTDDGSGDKALDASSLSRFSLNQTKVGYKMK
ncbi:17877_t:CDS:2, partial [Cetraspora pellucida]